MDLEITPHSVRRVVQDTLTSIIIQYKNNGCTTFTSPTCGTSTFSNQKFTWNPSDGGYITSKRGKMTYNYKKQYIIDILQKKEYRDVNTLLHLNKHIVLACEKKCIAWTSHPQGGKTIFTFNVCMLCIEMGYVPIVITSNMKLLLDKMMTDFKVQAGMVADIPDCFEIRSLKAAIKKLAHHKIGMCLANESKFSTILQIVQHFGSDKVVVIRDEADEDKTVDNQTSKLFNQLHADSKLIQFDVTATPENSVFHMYRDYHLQIQVPLPPNHKNFGDFPIINIPLAHSITYPINDETANSFEILMRSVRQTPTETPMILVYCDYRTDIQRHLAEWISGKYRIKTLTLNQNGNVLHSAGRKIPQKSNLQIAINECMTTPLKRYQIPGLIILGHRKFNRGLTFRDQKHRFKPTHFMGCLSNNGKHLMADIVQLFGRVNGIYTSDDILPTLFLPVEDYELLRVQLGNKQVLNDKLANSVVGNIKNIATKVVLEQHTKGQNLNLATLDPKIKRNYASIAGPVRKDQVPEGAHCLTERVGVWDVSDIDPKKYRKFVNERLTELSLPTYRKSFHFISNAKRYTNVFHKHPVSYINKGYNAGGNSLSNYIYSVNKGKLTIIQRICENYLDPQALYCWYDAEGNYFYGRYKDKYETFN